MTSSSSASYISTQKMSTFSFVLVLKSYFLLTTVGLAFIRLCDKGKREWQSLEVCMDSVCHEQFYFPQHMLLLVRCIHQSMHTVMTLPPELRVRVPTVGAIQEVIL